MRHIVISMDVFAALWAKRKPGEDSENAILERMLGLPKGAPLPVSPPFDHALGRAGRHLPPWAGGDMGEGGNGGGIYNRMFRVHFPEDFEIFRVYKGKEYRAKVHKGRWLMDRMAYPSLFALSMAVSDSNENPWMHWRYRDETGQVRLIKDLRRNELTVAPLPPGEKPAPKKKTKTRNARTPR